MARLTLARKIAAITLIVWKKEVRFDANYLKPQKRLERLWLESLSIFGNHFPAVTVEALAEVARFPGEVSAGKESPSPVFKHASLRLHPMPSRTIEESH